MRNENDPTLWVDAWPLPGLTPSARTRIKAHILRAHAAYIRSPIDPYAFIGPMQQAFDGIASVLFESDVLTVEILENQLRLFVMEVVIAGGWEHFAKDEPRVEVFPGYLGHPSAWEDFSGRLHMLLSAEIADWKAKLLEVGAGISGAGQSIRFRPLDESYQAIEFDGRQYDLTINQAVVIRVLHAAQREKRSSVSLSDIHKAMKLSSGRMSQWFRGRNRPLYGKLIVQTASRYHYRLDI